MWDLLFGLPSRPPPSSVRDAADRMRWNWKRAGDALRAFRALPAVLPVADTGVQQHGNTPSDADLWGDQRVGQHESGHDEKEIA